MVCILRSLWMTPNWGSNQYIREHDSNSEGFLQAGRMGMPIHSASGRELENDSHRHACPTAEPPVLVQTDWLGSTSAEQDL